MTILEAQARIAEIRSRIGLQTLSPAASGDAFADTLRSTVGPVDPLSAADASNGAAVSGERVVEAAKQYLGTPYVYGGNNPESGLDCSALVQRAYADVGVSLPRVAKDQAREGTAVPDLAHARPGDLLAFGQPVSHIGIYAGGGQMVVAPHTGDVVKMQQVYATPTAIRRILPSYATERPDRAEAAGSTYATAASLRPAALGAVPYAAQFQQSGARYGVPPALLAAVAQVESGYDPAAVSGAGAQGLMQLMPSTARGLGVDALDPAQAVDGAARLLSSNLKQFGSLELALAAYNAGGGAVRRYGGIPPFAETQAYVPKVKAALGRLTGGAS